jgi:eukaryotic-like serine/threonine-protein kinase
MDDATSETDVFNELSYEFAERYRRGERPSLTEYERRHPGLAGEIRELFPALVMMEKLGSGDEPTSNPGTGPRVLQGPMPERLGDYRIIRELARGGMGVVYEAIQESLGRHVALKVLSSNWPMEHVQLSRFRREAMVAALLHHTNIVPVFFVGEDDGVHYYAMQYIRGQGLHLVFREIARRRRDGDRSRRPLSEVGRRLAFMRADSTTVLVYDLPSGTLAREMKVPSVRVDGGVALSSTGGLLR